MNIIVCLKQTWDTAARISLLSDGNLDAAGAKRIVNPYDEYALEEAVRIKERLGGRVIALSYGPARVTEALRVALALGADEAVRVDCGEGWHDEFDVAEHLAAAAKDLGFDLIVAGKMSVDNGSSQVPAAMAEYLSVPFVGDAVKLEVREDSLTAVSRRGYSHIQMGAALPAVVTVEKGINEPRFAAMPAIMRARKKQVSEVSLEVSGEKKMELVSYGMPLERPAGRMIEGEPKIAVDELVRALADEAKVL